MSKLVLCDDESHITDILTRFFTEKGYTVFPATTGEKALELTLLNNPDLVITDISMQGLSGLDLLHRIKQEGLEIPVIITTGNPSHHSAIQALREGAFDYLVKPFHLEEIAERAERAIANRRIKAENLLYSKLVSLQAVPFPPNNEFSNDEKSLLAWARLLNQMVNEHCPVLENKSEQVLILGQSLIQALQWPIEAEKDWPILCFVYELGKIRVPLRLLEKTEPITEGEINFIRNQWVWTCETLQAMPGLSSISRILEDFQENFDGTGKPRGLAGLAITPYARLLAVADAFIALQASRPYRTPYNEVEALAVLEKENGKRYDPVIVAALSQLKHPSV